MKRHIIAAALLLAIPVALWMHHRAAALTTTTAAAPAQTLCNCDGSCCPSNCACSGMTESFGYLPDLGCRSSCCKITNKVCNTDHNITTSYRICIWSLCG